jgi:hypothetical protein
MDDYYVWTPIIFGIVSFVLALYASAVWNDTVMRPVSFVAGIFSVLSLAGSFFFVYGNGHGQPVTFANDRLVTGYLYETLWQDGHGAALLQGSDGSRRYYEFSDKKPIPAKRFTVLDNGTPKLVLRPVE